MVTRISGEREHDVADLAGAIALVGTPGIGRKGIGLVLEAAKRVGTGLDELMGKGSGNLREMLPRGLEDVLEVIERCSPLWKTKAGVLATRMAASGVSVIFRTSATYPSALIECIGDSAPPLLFVRGNVDLLARRMAGVVGACEVSAGGGILAARCSEALVRAGACVVSGGAKGVDTAAHSAALAAGGTSVLVLPQGIQSYVLPSVYSEAIEEGRLAIVSEFAPEMGWERFAAVTRNATISALAHLVCVIEPRRMGGSLRTAKLAAAQGKPLFAHVLDSGGGRKEFLISLGARPLVENGRGAFESVLEAWDQRRNPRPVQGELPDLGN